MSDIANLAEAIAANTAAVIANNELLKEAAEGRERAIAAATAATAPKPASRSAKKAEEPTPAPAAEPQAEVVADEGPTIEQINAVIVEYTTGSTRPEEQGARAEKVAEIIRKTNAEGKTARDVPVELRGQFIDAIKTLITQGDLTTAPAAGGNALLG